MLIGRELFDETRDDARMTRHRIAASTPRGAEFRANADAMRALVDDLRAQGRRSRARRRRGRARQARRARQAAAARARRAAARPGLAVPRDRASSPPTACTTATRPAPASITGIGRVQGRECVIVANDATVKGGTYYPMTVKKHLRAQEIARAEPPAVHLPGRFRRRLPAEAGRGVPRPRALRPHLLQPGATCRPQGIPQIAVVMGSCTAGGAYVPAMCDEIDHRQEPGHDLPRRPAAGEGGDRRGRRRAEELGGGDVHTRISGVADHLARERRARARASRGASSPTSTARKRVPLDAARAATSRCTPPRSSTASIPADTRKPYDVREVIARIVDGSRVRRVQGALRHDAGHRLRAHLHGYPGRHPRQQRHPVLRVAR